MCDSLTKTLADITQAFFTRRLSAVYGPPEIKRGTALSDGLTISQAERLLRIASPLGPDVLTLRRLSVREAIGRPFTMDIEVVSAELDLQPSELIGKPVTCTVDRGHVEPRFFHGIVRGFARLGAFGRELAAYRLEVVPRLWQLSRTGDCRIFQEKSVKDIGTAILGEADVAPVRWGASVPTAPRVYCVQYNETDLDFLQRLLEEIGCGYYFEHKDNDHTLVICGANADFPLVPGDAQVVRPHGDVFGALTRWQPLAGLQPGKVTSNDFDGLKPNTLLQSNTSTVLGTPDAAAFEVFRWPGGQTVRPDADPSKVGMEGYESGADLITASGNDPSVFAGGRLKVLEGLDATSPTTWLVTEVVHEAFDETHLSAGGSAGYRNGLTVMKADRPWRPAVTRPRPAMPGLHSAIVTGPSGEEIHCDEFGRIKVHFLWDRAGKTDDTSSCWVRVAQGFAGKWGGSWQLPRVGDEVLVGFLDGDPDRPIAIGSVYNAEQKPIYTLPANKTQSGIKTKSSKGGGADNFNELRFEDKKGAEEINIQAEKDMVLLVKHDRTEHVKHDRIETVDHDHTETVKNNKSETVNVNRTEMVGGKHTETITGDRTTEIKQGNEKLTVKMGDMDTEVSMGNITETAKLGKIDIEAMQSITLKVGGSKIVIDQMGVTIEGMLIKVDAKLSLETKGLMSKHEASALQIIKGALVMIN